MSQPPPAPQSPLDAFDVEVYLDQIAPLLIGAPAVTYRDAVLMNLRVAKFMAAKVFAVELDQDCCDLAGVFTPLAPANAAKPQES